MNGPRHKVPSRSASLDDSGQLARADGAGTLEGGAAVGKGHGLRIDHVPFAMTTSSAIYRPLADKMPAKPQT